MRDVLTLKLVKCNMWFGRCQGNFFQNIGTIMLFAIIGTALSAMVFGGCIYLLGKVSII